MLETDDLIYIHCPKTGGIFVERVLKLEQQGRSLMGVHDPATQLTDELVAGRKVVGTVRNPWDWYVSFYHYALESCGDRAREKDLLAYGRGEASFRAFLFGATHLDQVRVPVTVGVFWSMKGLGTRTVERARQDGIGLCTLAYRTMYQTPRRQWVTSTLLDTARLHEGLWEVAGLDPAHKSWWAPQNVGCHAPAATLFDDDMAGWVARADQEMVESLGYTGPGQPAPWAVKKTP